MAKFDPQKAFESLERVAVQLRIMSDVIGERQRQITELEYPPEHDDQHEYEEFGWIIRAYTDKIGSVFLPAKDGDELITEAKIREWFVKIAAVAVAAVESMERRDAESSD